ncbi:MAG: MG2 domain-containing protein [Tepidisphaeraceae bacterium]|jgi:uncharacterized protein YfaS (alpha-2-macroglobulin family)
MSTKTSSAGRRRFWIVVACFAISNAAVWLTYDRIERWRQHGELRVEAFEPEDVSAAGPRPTLRWHFNVDVVPSSVYGRSPGSVTPAVAGHWSWDDPRTLCFTPEADLPRATRIVFTISDSFLRSRGGGTMSGPSVTSIDSAPLTVEHVQQVACKPMDRFVIEMRFSDAVTPSDVVEHLRASTSDGRKVRCEPFALAADRTVRIITESIGRVDNDKTTELNVSLAAGLTGQSGPLGLARDYNDTVELQRALSAMELSAQSPMRDRPYLILRFNNDVDPARLKQILSIDPSVAFTLEGGDDGMVNLAGDFKPGVRYTVTLAPPPRAAEADKYPSPGHLSAFVPDRQSGVWLENEQGYLSSAGNRTLLGHAVNVDAVRLTITRVYDNNLVSWRNAASRYEWNETESFSHPLVQRTIKISAAKNTVKDLRLSLDELLPAGAGHGVFRVTLSPIRAGPVVEPADDDTEERDYGPSAVVTLSDIGLTAKRTRDGVVVWATSLRTATPLPGVRVRVFSSKSQPLGDGITDAEGLAKVSNVQPAKDETVAVILADQLPPIAAMGPDAPSTRPAGGQRPGLTWLDLRNAKWDMGDSDTGGRAYLRHGYEAYCYTDRGVYRPGETVHLRAIVRGADNATPEASFPVRWLIRRPDLHDWRDAAVMLDADGAAKLDVTIPPQMPTGEWTALIGLPGETGSADHTFGTVTFQVEEFIPNRLKASLKFDGLGDDGAAGDHSSQSPRFNVTDGNLVGEIQSDYLFGRPAAGLAVELSTRLEPIPFSTPGWSDWTFGDSADVAKSAESGAPSRKAKPMRHTEERALDEAGHYKWSIDVAGALALGKQGTGRYQGPWQLTASAGVREAGGRAVTVAQRITVDALPAYIGVRRGENPSAVPSTPCLLQLAMVRPDGSVSQSNATLDASLSRESWNTSLVFSNGHYRYDSTRILEPVTKGTVHLSEGRGNWSPVAPASGTYVAEFRDQKSGAMASMEFEVTDGSPWDDNVSRDNPERLTVRLLPAGRDASSRPSASENTGESQSFEVGQTANVLVASPFAGRLLLAVETDDVVQTQVVEMPSTHVVIPVRLSAACRPNAFISATVIRAIDPNAKWQTHRAYGVTRVRIDPSDQRLNVALTGPDQSRPERSLDVGIAITDAYGNPAANTAVTLAAVDEGICQLTDFVTPDPLKYFAADRALGVESSDIYDLLMPEAARADKSSAVGGDKGEPSGRHITPVVARRVKPVSLAWVEVHTDSQGLARASFSVPEFEGRLRVMAVAYNAGGLGSSDKPVTVRSPVMEQSSWPRFAAPGDRFTVPVVLFNNTGSGGTATVSAEMLSGPATPPGLLGFGDDAQARLALPGVFLPAHGQKQIDMPVVVGRAAGVGHVRLHVAMNGEDFYENLEFPVRPAAPMMQFGGYAVAGTTRPVEVAAPAAVLPGTGSLAIRVSAWPSLRLPEGLDYLDRYPYGCVEQTTSTCFPLLALADIGRQIDPSRFDPDQIKIKIDGGIMDLIGMQTSDGGLAMWPGGDQSWPWGSVYAAHFLVEARRAGYDVPGDFYKHLLQYVRHQLDAGTDDPEQLETQAYAAYVLVLAGEPPRAILDRLAELATAKASPDEDRDQSAMKSDARLLLACAWMLSGRSDLADQLMPDSLPLPRIHRQYSGNIGSPIRDRALLIYALATVQPGSAALPDLVQRLADAGARDGWDSTQDTAFALLAIGKYLHNVPRPPPFDSARLLSGTQVLAEAQGGNPLALNVPDPAVGTQYTVRVSGPPNAAAYVSWLETGVPLAAPVDSQHGITIRRRYLSLDGAELTNHSAQSGQLVRVELTIDAPASQPNLVIEDLVPAGLEAENSRLATTAKEENTTSEDGARIATFADDRMDVRDDRVVIMGDMPDAGEARCEYLARAVTPGVYVVPPVRAEAMYDIATCAIGGAGGTFTVWKDQGQIAGIRQ